MSDYLIHTTDTAPEGAREVFDGLQKAFGLVPNVAGVMANSLPLLNSFYSAFGYFRGGGTFTPAERQVLLLTNAVTNNSEWAVAFHSIEAIEDGVPPAEVDLIRRGELPTDPRLSALSALSRTLIEERGHLDEADVKAFTSAGFHDDQVLETITCIAISTMTNYTVNVARPPVEAAFRSQMWSGAY
jgi:alkylhydroperoxidase family enzyme